MVLIEAGVHTTDSKPFAAGLAVLIRFCDADMAQRCTSFLPSKLGGAKLVCVHQDAGPAGLVRQLTDHHFDVVMLSPEVMRMSAAEKPVPGCGPCPGVKPWSLEAQELLSSRVHKPSTRGWSVKHYYDLVRNLQGGRTSVVGTLHERELVPILRQALRNIIRTK